MSNLGLIYFHCKWCIENRVNKAYHSVIFSTKNMRMWRSGRFGVE